MPDAQILGIRTDEILDLGQGHQLSFINVPTPRWPDGICTFDQKTQILYSDKFFSVHLCSDALWDKNWKELDVDRRYYFDCLHAVQSKAVETALDKIKEVFWRLDSIDLWIFPNYFRFRPHRMSTRGKNHRNPQQRSIFC